MRSIVLALRLAAAIPVGLPCAAVAQAETGRVLRGSVLDARGVPLRAVNVFVLETLEGVLRARGRTRSRELRGLTL